MADQDVRDPAAGHDRPMPPPSQLNQPQDDPVVETTTAARQGFLGRPVAVVLAISLAMAVMAGFLIVWVQS